MSLQSRFKIKRPRSPDSIGIHNYKKQRLIEDLENLSISDSSNLKARKHLQNHSQVLNKEPAPAVEAIYFPYAAKSKAIELLKADNVPSDEYGVLYSKLQKILRNKGLQMIKWRDLSRQLYTQWVEWIQKKLLQDDYDVPMDYPGRSMTLQSDFEGDIDMDT